MKNQKVPGKKITAIIALYLIGSSLVESSVSGAARQDSWFCVLLATGLALLLAWLYSSILRLHPGKGLFDIAVETLGAILGKIVCAIFVLYAVYLAAQIIRVFEEFVHLVNLPETPEIAMLIFTVPLVAWQVRSGLNNMASVSAFLLPFLILFAVTTFMLGMKFMDPENIRPILSAKPTQMLKATIGVLALPYGETILCTSFFGEVDQKESPFKIMAFGILIAGAVLVMARLRNLLILGSATVQMYLFPSYDAVGVISLGDFVTRISVLIGVNLVLAGIIKVSAYLYSATLGISRILEIRDFLSPAVSCCLLVAGISGILYSNILDGMEFINIMPYYSVWFQIFLPAVILIAGKLKKKTAGGKKKPEKDG
ncbi:MAG: endospore germination permease [Oscillospiraceae bacterium]|jgi:spore germination protein KB|nr:endospore germination permease [Oscillospiraceae bacterium]